MKKIMFNDKYGLTDAVLCGRKPMTRRFAKFSDIDAKYLYEEKWEVGGYVLESIIARYAKYKVGEVVAIAQSYKDAGLDPKAIIEIPIKDSKTKGVMQCEAQFAPGWTNKMFVRASLMPHHIRFTAVHMERLQDISDEDCIKELGLKHIEASMGFKKYQTHMVYQFLWDDSCGRTREYSHESPKEVFAVMIDKICGNGTWEDNPFVFVYKFELVD